MNEQTHHIQKSINTFETHKKNLIRVICAFNATMKEVSVLIESKVFFSLSDDFHKKCLVKSDTIKNFAVSPHT